MVKIGLFLLLVVVLGCSKEDIASCTPITCLNGGVSTADCGCICSQGFTGSNCDTQLMPSIIKITKIKVTSFPSTRTNLNLWDEAAFGNFVRPDIFPFLYVGSTILFQGLAAQDAVTSNSYTWTPSQPILLNTSQFNSQIGIKLYDEDSSITNEFMGGGDYYIYNSNGGFPTTLIVDQSGPVTFELTLSYVW